MTEYRSEPQALVRSFKELTVYRQALDAAMALFEATKHFPAEERFSLVDQVRRSSRSVCANLGESWRKRRYRAAFVAKLSDAESEAAETQVWIDIARRCGYLSPESAQTMHEAYEGVIRQLVAMIDGADRWLIR